MRKRLLLAAAALLLVAAGAAGAYVLQKRQAAADVRGSSTEEFVATDEILETLPPPPTTTAPPTETGPAQPPKPPLPGVVWPTYGYDNERHRVAPYPHRPPYRQLWMFRARQLLEFPPAIAYGRLYFTNNSGVMFAVNAKTGKRAWRKEIGRCVAASPAVVRNTVFQAFLNRPPCNSERP
ncbi:MAG TPA: PQQ-binding-like beta-propeller repeat protein, partial [Gaiellaceae bacterium]|nr:PQQ-binding-like beta-propeller repeat protein [Gaiellaceae bacterium]